MLFLHVPGSIGGFEFNQIAAYFETWVSLPKVTFQIACGTECLTGSRG